MELSGVYLATAVGLAAFCLYQRRVFKKHHPTFVTLNDAISAGDDRLVRLKEEQQFLEREVARWTQSAQEVADVLTKEQEELTRLLADKGRLNDEVGRLEKRLSESKKAYAQTTENLNGAANKLNTQLQQIDVLTKDIATKGLELQGIEDRFAHVVTLDGKGKALKEDIDRLLSEKSILEPQCKQLRKLMGKVDLYSRLDEYVQVGHFENPEYLYETPERFAAEINIVRAEQKEMIKACQAVECSDDAGLPRSLIKGQIVLMLNAFNVECDLLIGKVSPGGFERTLEQIEKRAEQLEKNAATLHCGFHTRYVELKFEECKLQYQYKLKKQDEMEEQRLIREQMREEIRVQKQYEDAIREAEKEEIKYRRLLERAREQLVRETGEERALTLARIDILEEDLREALEKGQRAKSMAEQTRRGYVYVISNIGSFGEGVYKIGLTRRLDPQERVDELSSASVPFPFDVHAMCYSEDAPSLEAALHRKFHSFRVNAVNVRKEFFKLELAQIRAGVIELLGSDVDFTVTAKAEAYYESKRLRPATEYRKDGFAVLAS